MNDHNFTCQQLRYKENSTLLLICRYIHFCFTQSSDWASDIANFTGTGFVCNSYIGQAPYSMDIVRIFNLSDEICKRSDMCFIAFTKLFSLLKSSKWFFYHSFCSSDYTKRETVSIFLSFNFSKIVLDVLCFDLDIFYDINAKYFFFQMSSFRHIFSFNNLWSQRKNRKFYGSFFRDIYGYN